jgi:RimJ/RimL family protein N-acetyltransferase
MFPGSFMEKPPLLETRRLRLGPLSQADAPALQRIAGRRELADTTISIPHPFTEEHARQWISDYTHAFGASQGVGFGISMQNTGELIGTVVLRDIDTEHNQAELSLWLDRQWWGHGYATEAAGAVVRFGFEQLGLNRIYGHHMVRNPASGRVLEKIGMRQEGLLRQRVRKWDVFEDVVLMAILRSDWKSEI